MRLRQTRGLVYELEKDKEEWWPEPPLNQIQEITFMFSNKACIGKTPLKITLFLCIQIHHVVANQIK
jgi:hypothetical protein